MYVYSIYIVCAYTSMRTYIYIYTHIHTYMYICMPYSAATVCTFIEGWRFDVAAAGGGLFVDIGSHALDLLDFLFGPLEPPGLKLNS